MRRPSAAAGVARSQQIANANERLANRRSALRILNGVVGQLGRSILRVEVKDPKAESCNKLFRFLARRELDPAMAATCRDVIVLYVDNGGKLPENVSLSTAGVGLVSAEDATAPVPRHKVLKSSFCLDSRSFMLTCNSTTFTPDTWSEFKAWVEEFARAQGARAWAACLEESLEASAAHFAVPGGKRHHLHAYFIWVDDLGLSLKSLDVLQFQGVRPRVDVCKGPGSSANIGQPRRAALHGLWYVTVMKEGKVYCATNFHPWQNYTPSAQWLQSLYDSKKLSHRAFLDLSAKFRTGHAKRKRDVDTITRQELEAAVDEHVAAELVALESQDALQPFNHYPEVAGFVESFGRPQRRRPVLLLVGGTNVGKSLLGAEVLRQVGEVLQVPSSVEVTVEDDDAFDLSGFDHRQHAGVLLDGVGDALSLWRHREVLQGRPKNCRGGRSATMVYSYPFTLARRAVVATMDLTAKNLHLLRTNHWLKDSRNVLCLELVAPAFIPIGAAATVLPPTSRADTLAAWSVHEVAVFYEGRDAVGVAKVFQQNAVNGSDLASFATWQALKAELCMTPFAAKKALALRDAFLSG